MVGETTRCSLNIVGLDYISMARTLAAARVRAPESQGLVHLLN